MFEWFDEFKASVEAGIKSGIESSVLGLAQSFMNGIEEFFKVPEPDGAFELIRTFHPSTVQTISIDGVTIEEDCWKIESYGEKKVLLFEIAEPNVSECLLLCQAQVKTANLCKPAKLTLSARNSAGWTSNQYASAEGTTIWHLCKVPFHFKKQGFSESLAVSVEFQSGGVFWLKDVEILQAPVKQSSNSYQK